MADQPPETAGALVAAAVDRLEERGLVDTTDDGHRILNSDGMAVMLDALTLWNIHTQGDDVDDDWKLSHDTGVAFQQALHLCLFPDAPDQQRNEARRGSIQAIRRASRNHSY